MLLSLPSGNLCHLHLKCCMASTGQHFTTMKLKSTFFGPFVSGTVAKWLKWVHSLGFYRLSALSLPVWGLPNRSSCHRFEIEATVHHVGRPSWPSISQNQHPDLGKTNDSYRSGILAYNTWFQSKTLTQILSKSNANDPANHGQDHSLHQHPIRLVRGLAFETTQLDGHLKGSA